MNNNEAKDIAITLSIVLDSIFNLNSEPEDVANLAIEAIKDIIRNNPKVREWMEEIFQADSESPDFQKQWDREIAFIKFIK